jgi:hypothetical protein
MGGKDGYRIWIPNERKIVLAHYVHFKPEVVCNSSNNITRNESMCPELHITPTEEIQVSQDCERNEESTASTFGGRNGSNAERYVQVRKNVCEKKQPNWMNIGEFARLVNDSQGDCCLNPISYTEAMQSNEQKQWKQASLKENET